MNKSRLAAVTGVMYYLREKEEQDQWDSVPSLTPCRRNNPWASFGRKTIARQRSLVQGKAFKKHGSFINAVTPDPFISRHRAHHHTCNQCRHMVLAGRYQVRLRIGEKGINGRNIR